MILRTAPAQYGFFEPEAASLGAKYHDRYVSAEPFPHIVLDEFVDEDILDLCIKEFPEINSSGVHYQGSQENLKFEFKPETLSPPLRSFFYSLNSMPFIGFLESLTGIKGLIPDPYFTGGGFHLVADGGHLNIHADFNRHSLLGLERRINVLIYLNRDWKEEYGGCFEIWDAAMRGPQERVVPLFNRCVIFNTSSTSFHGNPEPVKHPAKSPRRSIALYYYSATWDDSRHEHGTRFQVRPSSADVSDFRARAQKLAADLVPPLFIRSVRKVLRTAPWSRERRRTGR